MATRCPTASDALLIFLMVTLYIDIFKFFIESAVLNLISFIYIILDDFQRQLRKKNYIETNLMHHSYKGRIYNGC